MKIAVVGAGNVGLLNAILLSQIHEVASIDIAPMRIESINRISEELSDMASNICARDLFGGNQ